VIPNSLQLSVHDRCADSTNHKVESPSLYCLRWQLKDHIFIHFFVDVLQHLISGNFVVGGCYLPSELPVIICLLPRVCDDRHIWLRDNYVGHCLEAKGFENRSVLGELHKDEKGGVLRIVDLSCSLVKLSQVLVLW